MHRQINRECLFKAGGSFKNPELEARFNQQLWYDLSKRIRIVSLLTGITYLSGICTDILSLGGTPQFSYMMTARILTFTMALICALSTIRKSDTLRSQKVLFFYFLMICLSECYELILKPEMTQQYFPLLLMMILCYYLIFPVPYSYSLAGSLGVSIVYCTILLGYHKIPLQMASPTIISYILISAMSFFVVRNLNRAKRSEAYVLIKLEETNEELQREISERQKAQKRLEELATRDELTNAYNRRHFTHLANREIQRAERTGQSINLLFLDIDLFKSVNDQYGHDAGDRVLKKLTEICLSNIRELDTFARMGGEEFAILLPEIDGIQAKLTAHRLCRIIADTPIPTEAGDLKITVSIGVSTYSRNISETLEKMLKQADIALYEAKAKGRNRVEMPDTVQ